MGKDRRGWVYQGQLAFAAKELARSTHSAPSNATAKSPDLAQATNFTFWGLYVITMYGRLTTIEGETYAN